MRKLIPPKARFALWRTLYAWATALSRVGERLHQDWLIYNPLLFLWFHLGGRAIAPTIYRGFQDLFPNARRYLDVGAGTATVAAYGRGLGLEVLTCEHSPVARWFARRQGVPCVDFDLTRDPPAVNTGSFDVAYCFEVGEHLASGLSEPLVTFIASKAPTVVFSAARPGQGGHGHINEQPPSYWSELFDRAGYHVRPDLTENLRARFRSDPVQVDWLINNVQVFESAG